MSDFFDHPLTPAFLWFAAIFTLLALALIAVRRLRGGAAKDVRDPHELLTKFRELHARGGLSDEEYRTIKTKLAAELDAELNDSDQKS